MEIVEKGGKMLLEKANTSGTQLTKIGIGCGWDPKEGAASGADFDLDASVLIINKDGKLVNTLYYGTPKVDGKIQLFNGSLLHTGDNLTGEGEGDDETIMLDLPNIPAEADKLVVVVDIYQGKSRGQNFGMVENAFIRLFNPNNVINNEPEELIHFDLNFDASVATGVKFATIFRKGDEWAFSADQTEFEGGLQAVVKSYPQA